jgi:hypothetical protein
MRAQIFINELDEFHTSNGYRKVAANISKILKKLA